MLSAGSRFLVCYRFRAVNRANLANGRRLQVVLRPKGRFVFNSRPASRFCFVVKGLAIFMSVCVAITQANAFRGDLVEGRRVPRYAGTRDRATGRSQACALANVDRFCLCEGDVDDDVGDEVRRAGFPFRLLVAVRVGFRLCSRAFDRFQRVEFKCVSRRFGQDSLFGSRREDKDKEVWVAIVGVAYYGRSVGETWRLHVLRRVVVKDAACVWDYFYYVPFEFKDSARFMRFVRASRFHFFVFWLRFRLFRVYHVRLCWFLSFKCVISRFGGGAICAPKENQDCVVFHFHFGDNDVFLCLVCVTKDCKDGPSCQFILRDNVDVFLALHSA